jgi:hypothetical protein
MGNLEIIGSQGIAKAVSTEREGEIAILGIEAKGMSADIRLNLQNTTGQGRTPRTGTIMREHLYRTLTRR